MTNIELGELFAARADELEGGFFQKALKKAARYALTWPVEAVAHWSAGGSLQDLPGLGPTLEKMVLEWLEQGVAPMERTALRRDFLSLAEARRILAPLDGWRARGDLHMHTLWSDGSNEIEDMADEARRLGYGYIAITDHTKGLKIAGGIDEEKLTRQGEEIDALNARGPLRILRSAELNLTPSGELDLEAEALDSLDLVLACFHSKLRLMEDQTERYLAALRNPHVHILGHPRGRIYNFRLGLSADWERVLDEAARLDKAVEVDCFPDRQDLDVATLEIVRRSGARVSLGSDSHGFRQLAHLELGLAAVWKAGIPRERVLNFLEADELLEWVGSLRKDPASLGRKSQARAGEGA